MANSSLSWNLHLTVAAIIEHNNKFLLVTDKTIEGLKLNQPAGHVEDGEGILLAISREVKEETSLDFMPQKIIGIYLYKLTPNNTYLRFCFKGITTGNLNQPAPLAKDDGVLEAKWYDLATIKSLKAQLRSPLVLNCLEDYLSGKEFPLSILANYTDYSLKGKLD